MNLNNHGIITGRLTRDPKIVQNNDGSHKVRFTVAAVDNFQTKGEYRPQFIPLESYVRKDSHMLKVYDKLKKGSSITAATSIRTPDPYVDTNGEKVYPLVINIDTIKINDYQKTPVDALEEELSDIE